MSDSASFILLSVLFVAGCILFVKFVRQAVASLSLASGNPVPRAWGLADIVATFVLLTASQYLAAQLVAQRFAVEKGTEVTELEPSVQTALIATGAIATLVALAAALLWFLCRYGSPLRALGFAREFVVTDLTLGGIAFLAVAPVVYLIQFVLAQWIKETHPLIELLKENPNPLLFLAIAFTAVIVAPVAEEYLFRFLLQGWLERVARRGRVDEYSLLGGLEPVDFDPIESEENPVSGVLEVTEKTDRSPDPMWPIALSAALFALAHYSHGPAPIPLFVFAIVLGYLYRRTGRILPCIVLHLLLNWCSLVLFGLYLLYAAAE